MKNSLIILALFFIVASLPAHAQKEERKVSSFTKISFGISGELYLKQGPVQKVELEGDEDVLEKIETEVVGSQLRIHTKSGVWNYSGKIYVYITVPEIEAISLGGSGKVITQGEIHAEDLSLSVSGSGRMEMESLKVEDLDEEISGSGSLSLSGKASRVDLSISGSGRVNAAGLQVETYDVSISGSGKCEIWATGEIQAQISGSGSVYYKGEPERINANTSGSGKVRKLE
jgi:hypothetical protein